jgi:hypothetical protein
VSPRTQPDKWGRTAFLEVSGRSADPPGNALAIWIQVRYVQFEHERLLAAGVPVIRKRQQEPWGLVEMWIADPDGVRIVLVEVPKDHPCGGTSGDHFFSRGRRPDGIRCSGTDVRRAEP